MKRTKQQFELPVAGLANVRLPKLKPLRVSLLAVTQFGTMTQEWRYHYTISANQPLGYKRLRKLERTIRKLKL